MTTATGYSDRLLVTGLGGAVGSELAPRLVALAGEVELVAVFASERSRARFLANGDPALMNVLRVEVCDLSSDRDTHALAGRLPRVQHTLTVHAAINATVHATRNVAELTRNTSERANFLHVSPAGKTGAERMLRADFADLTPSVFSCSIVVGHSRTGVISRFHGLYSWLRLMDHHEIQVVPGGRDRRVDIVPVDWVADELAGLIGDLLAGGEPRDVVASAGPAALLLPELIARVGEALNDERRNDGRKPLREISVLGFRQWDFLRRSIDSRGVAMPAARVLDFAIGAYRPYLADDRVLAPVGTVQPLPAASTYLDQVVSYWYQRNGGVSRAVAA
jgi:hypothetical protein